MENNLPLLLGSLTNFREFVHYYNLRVMLFTSGAGGVILTMMLICSIVFGLPSCLSHIIWIGFRATMALYGVIIRSIYDVQPQNISVYGKRLTLFGGAVMFILFISGVMIILAMKRKVFVEYPILMLITVLIYDFTRLILCVIITNSNSLAFLNEDDRTPLLLPITDTDSETDSEPDNACVICYRSLEKAQSMKLTCGHEFHSTCIIAWLQQNAICPVCRDPFTL